MADKRDRRTAVHYGGALRILSRGVVTLISAGAPACQTRATANALHSLRREDVTCRRCLGLLGQHDRTAALENAMVIRGTEQGGNDG